MKKGKYGRKSGYALSLLMVALVVISIGVAAAIPILSMKKDTFANTSKYVKECIADQGAGDLNSTACIGAINGLTKGFSKDYESVLYYLSIATYRNPALNIIKASCDQGAGRACNVFLDRCAVSSSQCDIASSSNDLDYYIKLASSDVSLGKSYLAAKGLEYYLQGMSGFNNIINVACNGDMTRTACDIAAETKTMTYNFNAPQRSDFYESNSTTGTQFHDGIVDLMLGNGVSWANQYGGENDYTGYGAHDIGNSIAVSGNYIYVTGQSLSVNCSNNHSTFVMKLNISDGTVVWKKKWGAPAVWFNKLIVSGSNIYVLGDAEDNNTWQVGSLIVMKLDADDGSTVWERHYGEPDNYMSFGNDIKLHGSYLYISGREIEGLGWPNHPKILVLKMQESDGQIVWKNRYGSTYTDACWEEGTSIEVSSDGTKLYVAGTTTLENTFQAYIMKLNETDGTAIWRKAYGGSWLINVVVPGDGYVYASGGNCGNDAMIMKLTDANDNTGGAKVWAKNYGNYNNGWSDVASIIVSGNYIYAIGGEQGDAAGGGEDILAMKIKTSDGSIVWDKQYGGSYDDWGHQAVLSGDYIYITGVTRSQSGGIEDNIIVMKIDLNPPSSNITGWIHNGEDVTFWWGVGENFSIPYSDDGTYWHYSGDTGLSHGEPITYWDLPDIANQNNGVSMASGFWWGCDNVPIADGSTEWNNEGTTLDTEPINFFTIGLNNSAYITTTDNNHITNILGGIKSFSISSTQPSGTKIRGLVSFDGRSSWRRWNGSAWVEVTTNLATYNFSTTGNANTTDEIRTGLRDLTIGGITGQTGELDFAFYLETNNTATVSPSIDSVTITYLRGR